MQGSNSEIAEDVAAAGSSYGLDNYKATLGSWLGPELYEAVSKEVGEPIGVELRRVVTEARLGRPLEEALEERSSWVPWLNVEPKFAALRPERRFQALLARLEF